MHIYVLNLWRKIQLKKGLKQQDFKLKKIEFNVKTINTKTLI